MHKKKVLICGATGFIGKNVAEAFIKHEDFEVFGTYFNSKPFHDPKITMLYADLTRKGDVTSVVKGMDIIIQAAATTSGAQDIVTRPHYHVADNAVMNSHIFRAAHENGVSHVLFFSCTVMYQSSDLPVKETDFDSSKEMHPNYFGAAWTKVYIEKMCEFYSRIGNTKYTVIRHSNIYGQYDKYDLERSHVFGATVAKVMSATKNGVITVWGSGEEERDLLYVSDLVSFIEVAINKQGTNFALFNVGSGSSTSVNDLVKKIIAHSAKDRAIKYDTSKPTIKTRICLDITKALNTLGWYPKVSLDEGIQKTLAWYRAHVTP